MTSGKLFLLPSQGVISLLPPLENRWPLAQWLGRGSETPSYSEVGGGEAFIPKAQLGIRIVPWLHQALGELHLSLSPVS